MKFGIIIFPGSNCDRDCETALNYLDIQSQMIWHKDRDDLSAFDCLILPGGFSYGDYLRAGAMAARAPVMDAVEDFAKKGGPVIGICNGFQILLERKLLPGAMVTNQDMSFKCRYVHLRVENNQTSFTKEFNNGEIITLPIAHQEGNYFYPGKPEELEGQIIFRYSNPEGEVTPESNPNGSWQNVAGIINKKGNVLGMMPHPERAVEPVLGNGTNDGTRIFISILKSLL